MELVLIIGFWLLVITLVGHGIWLFVAFVFRSLTEPPQTFRPLAPVATPKRTCLHCGAWCAVTFQNCPTCGKPVAEPLSPTAKLQSLQRQIDLLLAEDVLSLEQFQSARTLLQEAADKFQKADVAEASTVDSAELPILEAADDVESKPSDVGQVSNLTVKPIQRGQVENLPHKRSTWTDWLQAFLEEKNIRWGELLAGLLIVGSSVGLVISLWSTLRQAIPYFPALCFLAVTAAIHGAGLYTLRHWRLKTTSRGLLTIALLLVPLNFLAAISLSEQRPATDPLYLTAVAIGVAAYGWITWSGAHELMHFGSAWLSLAVLGSAIGQLFIGRLTSRGLSTLELSSLFALPLATYVVALLSTSQFAARWRRPTPRRVESLYRLLGIAFFSLAVSLGLLLWKSQSVIDTLSRLSPCVNLAAAMIVGVVGRLVPRKFVVPPSGGTLQPAQGGTTSQDIAATAVTLVGAMLMVAAVVLAWPDSERLIVVGLVNFVALSWFGFATGLAPLHLPALGSLALAGLIAFHQFGRVIGGAGITEGRTLLATILLGRSGVVLAVISLVTCVIAGFLRRAAQPPHPGPRPRIGGEGERVAGARECYLVAAAGIAVLSLGIAVYAGFWPNLLQPSIDRSLATVVFALFGIAGMVANERLNRIEIAWAGAVVWLAVFLHAFGWNAHVHDWLEGIGLMPDRPIVVALLTFATWSLGCAFVGKVRNRFVAPWSAASGRAIVVALFALPWKVWGDFGPHAIYLGWIAALCLGQAHLWQSRNVFSLSQAVAFIAAALGIASFAEQQDWWIAHHNEVAAFFDVRHGHWQMAGLAIACAPWALWRHFGGRWAVLARCTDWKVDRLVLPAIVVLFAAQTWFGLWPALGFELHRLDSVLSWRWDRVIAFLFGWGAVCWSVEEVTRSWFRRRFREVSVQVRIPWLSEVLSLLLAVAMFLLPEFEWSGAHHSSLWSTWPRTRELFFGPTAWWAMTAIASVLAVTLIERRRWLPIAGLIVAGWSAVLLANVWWDRSTAGTNVDNDIVTGLLWSLTGFTALVMAGNWLTEKWLRRTLTASATGLAIWLCLLPVTVLMRVECEAWTMHARPMAIVVHQHWNPVIAAFVCILPLVVWTFLLAWQAARQRSAVVLFGASHAWVLAFALMGLIMFYRDPIGRDVAALTRLLQWSLLGLGTFSLVWYWRRSSVAAMAPSCFETALKSPVISPWLWQQLWTWGTLLFASGLAAILVFEQTFVFHQPNAVSFAPYRSVVGHLAILIVVIAAWLVDRAWPQRCHWLGLALLAWVPLLAASLAATGWLSSKWGPYHVWEVGWLVLVVGWSVSRAVMRSPAAEIRSAMSLWSDAASMGAVFLALREFWFHESVVWPSSSVAVVATSAALLAWKNRSQWRVATSTTCVVLATAMAWTRDWDGLRARSDRQLFWWLEASVTALALAACAWQAVEVWWQYRRSGRFDPSSQFVTAEISSRIAFDAALGIVLLVTLSQMIGPGWSIHEFGGWLMVLAAAAPFVVSWWDRFAKRTVDGIYGAVWLILLMTLIARRPQFDESWLTFHFGESWLTSLTRLIAVNVSLVGAAWWIARGSDIFAPLTAAPASESSENDVKKTLDLVALRATQRDRLTEAERWLANAEVVWALFASALAILSVLTFEDRALRFWNVASAALLMPGIALMARSQKRDWLQRVALGLGAVWAVEFLWAWMEPQPRADFWLQRSIRALEALALTALVYGVGLVRVVRSDRDWRPALQRAARDVAVAAIVVLMIVLTLEAWWFDPVNGSPVTGLQIALVATTLVGLAVALLAMALTDQKIENVDRSAFFTPQAFVYAAEIVAALLFLHCYLTMPELFRGYLQPYWPLIVMAIAFGGVGASELCQRAKLNVLSEPLQNSAAFLPLIPALGFWVVTSRTDHSTVLFAAGLIYVLLNLRRRSFWYVLAASLAGNFGLWALWSEHGVELLVRPQVWLIPPAVSVLAAAQWNRSRLTDAQLAAIRYPSITLIYVSSAGEMFMTGIAESFWLPVVLMVLSVIGVLAGIWLRVRAFLYLGTSFLLLSLVSMVWHAAEAINHTWPWWAFGIGLGLGVLTLFGLFERKRNEMLRLLGELRTWER